MVFEESRATRSAAHGYGVYRHGLVEVAALSLKEEVLEFLGNVCADNRVDGRWMGGRV